MNSIDSIKLDVIRIRHNLNQRMRMDGGPGSGNWGHKGRKGEVGGSGKGTGGSAHRYKDTNGNYTSYAKVKHSMAKAHQTNTEELKSCPKGTKLITKDGKFTKVNDTKWMNDKTGEIIGSYTINHGPAWNTQVKIAFPKEGVDAKAYMTSHGAQTAEKSASKSKAKSGGKTTNKGFSSSYSAERISKATKHTEQSADDTYREETGKIWTSLSASEKESIYGYTSGSSFVNEPLRHEKYQNIKGIEGKKAIHEITSTIDKAGGLKEDTILNRGIGNNGFSKVFSLPSIYAAKHNPKSLIGLEGKDDGFGSTGVAKGKEFNNKPVIMEIFAPKGTKGLYVEPFSHFGAGDKNEWDGKSKQDSFGLEQEYLLQRGTSYKITDASFEGGVLKVKCVITGQDYSDNPEEKWAQYCGH